MLNIDKKELYKKVVYEIEVKKNCYCINEVCDHLNISDKTLYKDNNFETIVNLIRDAKQEYISHFTYKLRFSIDKDYYINELIKFRIYLNNFKISFGKFDSRGNFRFNNVSSRIYSIYDGYSNGADLLNAVAAFNKGFEYCKEEGVKND